MNVMKFDCIQNIILVVSALISTCCINGVTSQSKNCTSKNSCEECIGLSYECSWCQASEYEGQFRCDVSENIQKNCSQKDIVNPKSELFPLKNESSRNAELGRDPIQLSPQEIKIKLRSDETFKFLIEFRQAKNYPVDIYFILDASYTMSSYKEALQNLTDKLVDGIRNITSDYQLGFGSFVDKPTLPYMSTAPDQHVKQCNTCDSQPYGFINHLSLTTNEIEFQQKVKAVKNSGNLDAPEGGFDAIMQAVVCQDIIGWRKKSRKLILFSTDGSFHYAGDGKLGGIVIPNDCSCHIDSAGIYSESLNQDYPSISQLAHQISENKINVIFIIKKEVPLYKTLSSFIIGSSVGELDANSTNVIQLITDNYNTIQSQIELMTEDVPNGVSISFKVRCPDNKIYSVPRCEKLKIGEKVTFEVSIRAESCPSDKSMRNRTFTIFPVGLNEKLIVHLERICDCSCEMPVYKNSDMKKCLNNGTYECGICKCEPEFYGSKCECDQHSDMSCRRTSTSEVCEGRGSCKCGKCDCNAISTNEPTKRFSGLFCQCNNYNCKRDSKDQMCGGRGICECGECRCRAEYTGPQCEYCVNVTSCRAINGEMCNGKGHCKSTCDSCTPACAKCECDPKSFYYGPTCERCSTCQEKSVKCAENQECAACPFRDKSDPCHVNCTNVGRVDSLKDYQDRSDWDSCTFVLNQNCRVHFVYKLNDDNIKTSTVCVVPVSNVIVIASVVGAVIGLGIVGLIIWKVVVTIHDRQEYEAFKKEQREAIWPQAENPIYKDATSKFKNPIFDQSGSR